MEIFTVCGEPTDTRPLPDTIDENASIQQMPWMTSLGGFKSRNKWDHKCVGSLITNRHVLTVAHCLDIDDIKSQEYIGGLLEFGGLEIRFGTTDLWNVHSGIIRSISGIFQHPQYDSARAKRGSVFSYFDVGVVVSQKTIEFTDTVLPICLPMRPVDDENALEGKKIKVCARYIFLRFSLEDMYLFVERGLFR